MSCKIGFPAQMPDSCEHAGDIRRAETEQKVIIELF